MSHTLGIKLETPLVLFADELATLKPHDGQGFLERKVFWVNRAGESDFFGLFARDGDGGLGHGGDHTQSRRL